jgi:hypothetical protein
MFIVRSKQPIKNTMTCRVTIILCFVVLQIIEGATGGVLKAKFLKPYTMIKKAVFWVSISVKLFMAY